MTETKTPTKRGTAAFTAEERSAMKERASELKADARATKDRAEGEQAVLAKKMGESEAVVLAEHLERGGEPKRAITFYRRAAAQALEGNDLEACLARQPRLLRHHRRFPMWLQSPRRRRRRVWSLRAPRRR